MFFIQRHFDVYSMTANNTILNCKLKLSYYGLSSVFILLFTSISILTSAQDSISTKRQNVIKYVLFHQNIKLIHIIQRKTLNNAF